MGEADDKKRDEILRRILNSPPQPRKDQRAQESTRKAVQKGEKRRKSRISGA